MKIVEFYTEKLISRMTLYISATKYKTDDKGQYVGYIVDEQKNINVSLSECKNVKDMISSKKLDYFGRQGILFLASNEKNLFGAFFLPDDFEYNFENLKKLSVDGNTIYRKAESLSVNDKILKKIEEVHNMIKSSCKDYDSIKPTEATVDAIKKSYVNTAVITKDDLKWLNKIWNVFKQECV